MSRPLPFYVVGPTGSGKSGLAEQLARATGGEIVNADAYQIYQGLPILTACPSPAARAEIPHHLYEVLPTSQTCHAGRYLELALPVLAQIADRGRLAIVTGGSGLYIKALTHGLTEAPASHPALRSRLDHLTRGELAQLLQRLDPASAASIEPQNRRYIQRAVEISLLSGQPASALRHSWTTDPPGLRGVCLTLPRSELRERIHRRTVAMLRNGAIEEVRAVQSWSATSAKAIGVPEIQRLLRGEIGEEECIEAIDTSTRRYAKRQSTWFRKERWLTPVGGEIDGIEIAGAAGLL